MADTKANVGLPREIEAFVEEREREREAVLTELRQEVEIGVEQAKAGRLTDGSKFFEQLKHRIRSGQ